MSSRPLARRADGITRDMAAQHSTLQFDLAYSADEMQRIQHGFIPQSAADKWFMYYEDSTLFIHRNGTGYCIYKARFERKGEQYVLQQVIVNRDPLQNPVANPEFDRDIFPTLLRSYLLISD